MINNILIEICIGNVEDALKADRYPIDRIELNSALELGGLSSSVETLKFLKKRIRASICCCVGSCDGQLTTVSFDAMVVKLSLPPVMFM